jgi:hypothetical protein
MSFLAVGEIHDAQRAIADIRRFTLAPNLCLWDRIGPQRL